MGPVHAQRLNVMAGLDPAIHALAAVRWMPGSSPGMTQCAA
jgi:hypothetical protein